MSALPAIPESSVEQSLWYPSHFLADLQVPKDRPETNAQAARQQFDVPQTWLLFPGFHQ